MISAITLILIGFFVGTFGTLIGAGGGFLLVPCLLYLYPSESPDILTSISLAVVFLNATSGSIAYARNRRIDYRSGIIFAIASIPGAILGASVVANVSRDTFEPVFGTLMLAGGIYVFFKPVRAKSNLADTGTAVAPRSNLKLGAVISLAVGFISSFLGIGGGIIHVPTLIHLLDFPVHVATATSHFVLAIMSLVATAVHVYQGTLLPYLDRVLLLGVPVLFGAQLGAYLSKRAPDKLVTRGLAVALLLVGVRLIFS